MNETPAPFVLPTNVTNVEDHRILFSSASLFSPSLHNDRVSIRTSTGRQHYRLYAIHKIPSLKVLDFTKIKQSERERAQRLAASAAGAAMEADARLEARAAAAAYRLSCRTFFLPRSLRLCERHRSQARALRRPVEDRSRWGRFQRRTCPILGVPTMEAL